MLQGRMQAPCSGFFDKLLGEEGASKHTIAGPISIQFPLHMLLPYKSQPEDRWEAEEVPYRTQSHSVKSPTSTIHSEHPVFPYQLCLLWKHRKCQSIAVTTTQATLRATSSSSQHKRSHCRLLWLATPAPTYVYTYEFCRIPDLHQPIDSWGEY